VVGPGSGWDFLVFFVIQASLETFFGLGLIVGPTVGGALYQASSSVRQTRRVPIVRPATYSLLFVVLPAGGWLHNAVPGVGLHAVPFGRHDRVRVARPPESQERRHQRR